MEEKKLGFSEKYHWKLWVNYGLLTGLQIMGKLRVQIIGIFRVGYGSTTE